MNNNMVSPAPNIRVKTVWGTFSTLEEVVVSLASQNNTIDPALQEAMNVPSLSHHDKFGTVIGFVASTLPRRLTELTPVIRVGETETTLDSLLNEGRYIAGLIRPLPDWEEQEGMSDGTSELQPQEEETKEQEA